MTALGRAREALLDAKSTAERNPSGANLQALEEAQAHMDYLLDTLPLPPSSQELIPPGTTVSLEQELLAMQEGEG